MKNILVRITLLVTSLTFLGCEEALERLPLDQLTVPTTFTTYNNVQTYSWTFYGSLGTYHLGNQGLFDRNENSGDLMMDGRTNIGSNWLQGRIVVPSNSNDWNVPYQRIRAVNIMLDNLEKSQMNESEIKHWRSVGYFFRSLEYFELLKKYGGVPWVENAIGDGDTEVLSELEIPVRRLQKTFWKTCSMLNKTSSKMGKAGNQYSWVKCC
jgi:starch-binding outer membrane protein, SusD/RagB family